MATNKQKRQTCFNAFSNYVRNKEMYQRATFRIREDGSTVWLINGGEMPDELFRELYPIGLINKSPDTIRIDSRQNIF